MTALQRHTAGLQPQELMSSGTRGAVAENGFKQVQLGPMRPSQPELQLGRGGHWLSILIDPSRPLSALRATQLAAVQCKQANLCGCGPFLLTL